MLRPHLARLSGVGIVQPSGKPCRRSHSVGVIRLTRTRGNVSVSSLSISCWGSISWPPVSSGASSSSVSPQSHVSSVSPHSREVVPSPSVVSVSLVEVAVASVEDDVLVVATDAGLEGERGSVSAEVGPEVVPLALEDNRLAVALDDVLVLVGDEGVGCSVSAGQNGSASSRELEDGRLSVSVSAVSSADDVLLPDVPSVSGGEEGVRGSVALDLRGEVAVSFEDDRLAVSDPESASVALRSDRSGRSASGSVGSLAEREAEGLSGDVALLEDVLEVVRRERVRRPVGPLDGSALNSVCRSDDHASVANRASWTSGHNGSDLSSERLRSHAAVRGVIENRSGVRGISSRDNEYPPSSLG